MEPGVLPCDYYEDDNAILEAMMMRRAIAVSDDCNDQNNQNLANTIISITIKLNDELPKDSKVNQDDWDNHDDDCKVQTHNCVFDGDDTVDEYKLFEQQHGCDMEAWEMMMKAQQAMDLCNDVRGRLDDKEHLKLSQLPRLGMRLLRPSATSAAQASWQP